MAAAAVAQAGEDDDIPIQDIINRYKSKKRPGILKGQEGLHCNEWAFIKLILNIEVLQCTPYYSVLHGR